MEHGGATAQARSKRRRILAKFLAHVGSECVRCAMLLLGAVLDMTCAQKHSFETCALLFPTFFRSLPLSVREEMFGNGFHARIGAVILPASSSGCEWYSLRSFNMALAHGMALLLHCIALLLSTGLAQAAISSLSASYLLLLSLVLPPSLCSCVRCPHLDSCFCCFFWASCLARVASSCIVHVWRGLCQLAPAR